MPTLTAIEQATLDALTDEPVTAAEICARTRRSRSSTDKALARLARTGLATRTDPPNPPGGPARWMRATVEHDPDHPTIESPAPGPDDPEDDEPPADQTEHHNDTENDGATEDDGVGESEAERHDPDQDEGERDEGERDEGDGLHSERAADDRTADEVRELMERATGQPQDSSPAEADPATPPTVKICRGCQEQIPAVCPTCWQRTTSYCGACRQNLPATRRGNPAEPQILPNGLRKLNSGELELLVAGVMRDHPVPDHVGIVGWTPGRIAIFLPGRSTGAIAKALDRLTDRGHAELLGHTPKRYRPVTDTADSDGEDRS
jgi:hypothetical protein